MGKFNKLIIDTSTITKRMCLIFICPASRDYASLTTLNDDRFELGRIFQVCFLSLQMEMTIW